MVASKGLGRPRFLYFIKEKTDNRIDDYCASNLGSVAAIAHVDSTPSILWAGGGVTDIKFKQPYRDPIWCYSRYNNGELPSSIAYIHETELIIAKVTLNGDLQIRHTIPGLPKSSSLLFCSTCEDTKNVNRLKETGLTSEVMAFIRDSEGTVYTLIIKDANVILTPVIINNNGIGLNCDVTCISPLTTSCGTIVSGFGQWGYPVALLIKNMLCVGVLSLNLTNIGRIVDIANIDSDLGCKDIYKIHWSTSHQGDSMCLLSMTEKVQILAVNWSDCLNRDYTEFIELVNEEVTYA